MSCNGCRVLRKGCSENCVLRHCLRSIDGAEAQAHATLFVAKFFGRAALFSFISAVSEPQRPALFQSLLFEAVGRTINPVGGVVGLLWTGNWQLCQAAVETVIQGGALHPIADFHGGVLPSEADDCSESVVDEECCKLQQQCDLVLSLMSVAQEKTVKRRPRMLAAKRSKSTEGGASSDSSSDRKDRKLLRLFV